MFSEHVEPEQFFRYLAIDKLENAESLQMKALANINGTVNVWRPTSDLLVIQRLAGAPIIYGRCP